MRLTKTHVAVITILNIVIAALLAFIFLYKPGWALGSTDSAGGGNTNIGGSDGGNGDGNGGPVGANPEHVKTRSATDGRVSEIVRETRLMGTGDESVVELFVMSGVSYIFGNATVGDYDFDGYGGFLCIVDGAGSITRFGYYKGRMTAVGMIEGGYAVATTDNSTGAGLSRLYFTDLDGSIKEIAELDGEGLEIIVLDSGRIAVVTKPNDNSFKLTEYAVAQGESAPVFTAEHNTRISSGYTLDYFNCFQLGEKYILAARAYSLPRYDSIVFYTFEAGGDASAHFYGGSGDSIMQPYAVLPYASGYLALCRRDGVAAVISVDYGFVSYRRDLLGFAFTSARLDYANGKYYACFEYADGVVTYEIDNRLNRRIVSSAQDIKLCCAVNSGGTVLVGTTEEGIRLADLSGTRVLDLDIDGAIVCGGFKTADGYTTLVLSATGGDAVTVPTGGRDIYIVTVKI